MRTLIAATLPLAALLAACGGAATNNAAANDSAAANAAAPSANSAAPAPAAIADPRRQDEIGECVDDVRNEVEPGADLNAFCGCAVDKIAAGLREREAMDQCAPQFGVRERQR